MATDITEVLRSTVHDDGTVSVTIEAAPMPEPAPHEVVVRVDASPINPSDLGMLLAGADAATLTAGPHGMTATLPDASVGAVAGRLGQPMPVGNEGAGEVIAAGSSADAQALLGKIVGMFGGGMYARHRAIPTAQCFALSEGTTAEEGASCFVNPMTALGMVETMRLEGHGALVHTAAASNLGQMLQRLCIADEIALVNIVRREEQAELLRSQGAIRVCDSSDPDFLDHLTYTLAETGATLAFDAIGGGDLASTILTCMERAAARAGGEYSRYGSDTHKQVYIYGGLDRSPTVLNRSYGMAWGVGGWLLPPFLARIGADETAALQARVADEIATTFASSYTAHISLADVVDPDVARSYAAMATGEKYLITPNA